MKQPVVAVALSGGVDSLVSGYLLKQHYKKVFGLHFTTGYEKDNFDAKQLEEQLHFPVTTIDLSTQFEEQVVRYFVNTYLEGKTPNPCLICNVTIKFGALLDQAKKMGADVFATGHYATVVNSFTRPDRTDRGGYLKQGEDPVKDQSYFLSLLSPETLGQLIFPLASMKKEAVKQFAASHNLSPLHPSESQDICFIHDNNFPGFILNKIHATPSCGDIVDTSGKVVGRHKGLHQYTIGQRRGLNCPASEPYYVRKIHVKENRLEVCFKKALQQSEFYARNINWNFPASRNLPNIITKIRYNHKGALSTLHFDPDGIRVVFDTPQNAVTPGQAAVFYKENRVLGAGIIQ